VCTRDIGKITLSMAKVMKNFPTGLFILAPMLMENQRGMVPIHGKMVRPMRESGLMGIKMAQGYGEDLRVILTLESGKMAKQMDTVSILGSMVIDTKASLKTVSSMEKVLRNLQMGFIQRLLCYGETAWIWRILLGYW
jgi:hypothetical protein